MATNLLIGFPDIPFNALSITSSQTYSTEFPVTNLVNGSRGKRAELATAYTGTHTITYDLGSGVTDTVNYFALLDVKILRDSGVTVVRLRGSDGVTPATVATVTLSSITLDGGQDRDYLTTFNETSAYRYWLVEMDSSGDTKRPVSKLYFGTLFDIGRDPQFSRSVSSDKGDKSIYEKDKMSLSYNGVSTTKRQDFESKIGDYSDANDVILYANSYTAVLAGKSLISCAITDYSFEARGAKQNDLRIELEESY